MKKGCFIQIVIILTILVAVIVYLIQNKLDDWLLEPGKELIVSEIIKDWDEEVKFISDSPEKDSLKSLVVFYLQNIKSFKEVVNLDEEKFTNDFKQAIGDSNITGDEISHLTILLKRDQNEKHKSH